MGKKGGTSTTVQSYQPTSEEKKLWQLQGDYEQAVMPNALKLNDKAGQILWDTLGDNKVDYQNLLEQAQERNNMAIQGLQGLANGQLPQAYTDNMKQTIQAGVNDSMGGLLNNLGASGVLNSSVTSKGIQDINTAASNAMANAYNSNISQLANLYGNLLNNAGANITTAAGAQEAAQQPALNLWNASIGLNGTNLGAISAMGGKGSSTSTQNTPGTGGLFGGVLAGLSGNAGLFCFPGDTKIRVPGGLKQLKDIEAGEEVTSPADGKPTKVTAVMTPHFAHTYTIVTEGGYVNTTDTQPLMKDDGTWATVKELTVGTKMKDKGTVMNIIYSGDRKVYNLKTESGMYYADGFVAKAATNEW